MDDYMPQDQQFLWCVTDPDLPRLVGRLRLVRRAGSHPGGVSLEYEPEWLASGFSLSEDMPLQRGEFFPQVQDDAAGAVNDARPDRWGERVIRHLDRPARLSTIEFLYFAGDERFGALGVSLEASAYIPRPRGALARISDVSAIHELVRRVESGQPVEERMRRLLAPGTLGGARPKAIVEIDDLQWVVKFADKGDDMDSPLAEHAAMTLAAAAGIDVCRTFPIPLAAGPSGKSPGHAVAVLRFDRGQRRRVHALTADVALRAAGLENGYPELALLLRRRGDSDLISANGEEIFRRMVFNILIDNTDDHEKNHAVLAGDNELYRLAPAYDVLPTAQSLGYQSIKVGLYGSDPTIENALSEHRSFMLTLDQARAICREVATVVERWAVHFSAAGVVGQDLDLLSSHIDREALRRERRVALDGAAFTHRG